MAYIGIIIELEHSFNAAKRVLDEFPSDTAEISVVDSYEEGVQVARRMVDNGVIAIVTRAGYIAHLRKENFAAPVIEIPFTLAHVTQTCTDAYRKYGDIGIVGTGYVIEIAKAMDSVLGSHIKYYCANTPADYVIAAKQARRDGAKVLVGGYDETRFAEAEGLKRSIIASGEDEFREVLRETMKIVSQIQAEAKKNNELKTLFDIIGDALIMVDSEGLVIEMNRKACRMLGVTAEEQLGRQLPDGKVRDSVMGALKSGRALPYDLQETNGVEYVCTVRIICTGGYTSGAVAKFQSVEYVQSLEHSTRARLAERGLVAKYNFEDIIGKSPKLNEAVNKAKQYSGVDSNLLISGESGTGKELFAQSIHNYSPRSKGPFVAINCATLPTSLLESELFGYSEDAFVGAKRGGKSGLFEIAHTGTIFLDEIGEIDSGIQARLLRVIEDKRVMRVGDDKIVPVNVRIIAATNKNLKEMVDRGQFREDLFYRLNVLNLRLPAMRERGNDVQLLIDHFLNAYSINMNRRKPEISPDGMKLLSEFSWPGNAREISNVMERMVVANLGKVLNFRDIMDLLGCEWETADAPEAAKCDVEQQEESVAAVIESCGGNKSAAAAMLGISRPTLYKKLREEKP